MLLARVCDAVPTGFEPRARGRKTGGRTRQRPLTRAAGSEPLGTRVADAREGSDAREEDRATRRVAEAGTGRYGSRDDVETMVKQLEADMKAAASALDFETAARIRDELFEIRAHAEGKTVKSRGSLAGIKVAG